MRFSFLSVAIILLTHLGAEALDREFRGAWLHTVFQPQYKSQSTEQNKKYLIRQLDSLDAMGINAVIFQVRPQADAFYRSDIEPWSIYLTDGCKAPAPFWDPLEFMVDECHKRGMEIHAWLNPYRITSNAKQRKLLPPAHIAVKNPERCIEYGGKLYFDPGLPENRQYIARIVDDIVTRYDIDAIHFDDYFYPYPIDGKQFADSKSYSKYGNGMKLDDWRRHNVDLLIEEINKRIKDIKPWVRFGISPFGIYRNKSSHPDGSDTSGLENYSGLYADVLLWEKKGWIDYLIPQLYWELEHKAASYSVLIEWWNNAAGRNRHLFIGQDVTRTMTKPALSPHNEKSQLNAKIGMAYEAENIKGNCWWPAYALTRNEQGVADSLCNKIHTEKVLPPSYPWLSADKPHKVSGIKFTGTSSFSWDLTPKNENINDTVKYGIYRYENRSAAVNGFDGMLVAITVGTSYTASEPGVYTVTAINRVNNESVPSVPLVIQ